MKMTVKEGNKMKLNEIFYIKTGYLKSRIKDNVNSIDTIIYNKHHFDRDRFYIQNIDDIDVDHIPLNKDKYDTLKAGEIIIDSLTSQASIITKQTENMFAAYNYYILNSFVEIDSDYFVAYFNLSDSVKNQVNAILQGTTLKKLTLNQLKDIDIKLHPIGVQKLIGNLYRTSQLKLNNAQSIKTYEDDIIKNILEDMSYTFYKYLSIYKQPQTERCLDYDNLVTVFKDFEYLTSDSFFKEIFSHVKYGTKKAKEVLDEFRNKKLDTTEQLKEHFSKLIDEMNDFGSDYHKFVKELVIGIARTKDIIDVYDPTFGTAEFLVEASRCLNVHKFYGEEIDFAMFNIGKMNMFINNINPQNIHFEFTNTILYSKFKGHRFDLIINEQPIEPILVIPKSLLFDIRFSSLYQTSMGSISDYSFIFHGLHLLKENGLFVTIVTPNLIFKELNRDIRKKFIEENNHLDTIIKLPKSLSSSHNMAMHILVFKKNRLRNEKVFFMDYSQEQYTTNKLRNDILSTYINKVELEGKSRYVDLDEIKENNYNLNVSRYIKKVDLYVRKETYELLEDIKRLEKERNEKQTNIENIINKLL